VRHAAGIPAAPPPDPDGEVVTIAEAAARLEILSLKGDSYRLRGKDLGARPAAETAEIG
jgi:hypothetical protein